MDSPKREPNKMMRLLAIRRIAIAIGLGDQFIKAVDESILRCLAEKQEELRQLLTQQNWGQCDD